MREQRLYAEALDACHQAEIALGNQPGEDSSHWWDEWLEVQVEQVWAHYWLAQWPEMDALVNKVQPVVQERGRAASRMRFLMASMPDALEEGTLHSIGRDAGQLARSARCKPGMGQPEDQD